MSNELQKPEAEYVEAEILFPPGYEEWANDKSGCAGLNLYHRWRKDFDPMPEPPEPLHKIYKVATRGVPGFEDILNGSFYKNIDEAKSAVGEESWIEVLGYHEEVAGKKGTIVSKALYEEDVFPSYYEISPPGRESYNTYYRFESIYYGKPVWYGDFAAEFMSGELRAFQQFGYDINNPYDPEKKQYNPVEKDQSKKLSERLERDDTLWVRD